MYAAPSYLKQWIKSGPLGKVVNSHPGWLNQGFVQHYRDRQPSTLNDAGSLLDQALYDSIKRGLPSLLRHEDRNSMAHSIESRLPFLDYRLAEFVFATPDRQKIYNGLTKYVLRNAMVGILPDAVRRRADKVGFATPMATWLRADLIDFVREIINSEQFTQRPYWRVDQRRSEYEAHVRGEKNIGGPVWRWVNLELWLRRFFG